MFYELFVLIFSGEGSDISGCSEDQTASAMMREITVHPNVKNVMYFA